MAAYATGSTDIIMRIRVIGDEAAAMLEFFQRKLQKTAGGIKNTNKGLGGFNAKLLTAAMTLKYMGSAAMGLLGPALDVVGIFDYFSLVLMDFFLPAIEPVADLLYWIGDLLMSAPDWLKKVVGWFVLLVAAVGLILGPLAFLQLGFSTVIGFIALFVIPILGGIQFVILAVGAPILILIGIIVLLYLAFQSNFLGIADIAKGLWNGLIAGIVSFIGLFTGLWEGLWTGNWDKFNEFGKKIIDGALNLGKDIVNGIVNGLLSIAGIIASTLWGLIPEVFRNFITGAADFIATTLGWKHGGYISGDKDYVTKQGLLYEGTGGQGTNNYAPNISINANINNSMDIRALGDQLNEYMYNEYRRLR